MRKIRKFFYLLGQGFVGIFRNSVMTTASILILICCMLIIGTFGLIIRIIDVNVEEIDNLNIIIAYLKEETEDEQITVIKQDLEQLNNVTAVNYISKDQALINLKEKMGDSADDLLDHLKEGFNPLPATFEIMFEDPQQAYVLLNSVEKIEGIEKTSNKLELTKSANNIKNGIMIIAGIMMAVLLIVALFVIINTIKLGVFARRSEISIMRYIGATSIFVVTPFIIEGILIGLIAAAASTGIQYYIYSYVLRDVVVSYEMGIIPNFSYYANEVILMFTAIGLFAGIVASLVSVKKYLKA